MLQLKKGTAFGECLCLCFKLKYLTQKLYQFLFSFFIISFFLSLSLLRCNVQFALSFYFCSVQVFLQIQIFATDLATLTGYYVA